MTSPQDLGTLSVPGPIITPVSAPFWAAASAGKLIVQRCQDCADHVFYPRDICPHCWSDRLEWVEASGRATLVSWTIVHKAGHPGWQQAAPYALGLVRLEEGPTMLSHLLAEAGDIRKDMALKVHFVAIAGHSLPMFEPAP